MSTRYIFILADLLLALVALPLIMQRVGPNRFYGFRTRRTIADAALWYRANAFAGRALFVAAAASALTVALLPEASFASPVSQILFLLPILVAIVASLAYLRGQP